MLAFCSLLAKAQFQNPFVYENSGFLSFRIEVACTDKPTDNPRVLPQDTIISKGALLYGISINYSMKNAPAEIVTFGKNLAFQGQVVDCYGREMRNDMLEPSGHWDLENLVLPEIMESEMLTESVVRGITFGGHYNWSWCSLASSSTSLPAPRVCISRVRRKL